MMNKASNCLALNCLIKADRYKFLRNCLVWKLRNQMNICPFLVFPQTGECVLTSALCNDSPSFVLYQEWTYLKVTRSLRNFQKPISSAYKCRLLWEQKGPSNNSSIATNLVRDKKSSHTYMLIYNLSALIIVQILIFIILNSMV